MTAFDRAEEIAAWLGNLHPHHGPNETCAIRDRIMSAIHEEKRELELQVSAQAKEIERLRELLTINENIKQTHLEDYSMSLGIANRQVDELRGLLALMICAATDARKAVVTAVENEDGLDGSEAEIVVGKLDEAIGMSKPHAADVTEKRKDVCHHGHVKEFRCTDCEREAAHHGLTGE